jgi:hypothetical protein
MEMHPGETESRVEDPPEAATPAPARGSLPTKIALIAAMAFGSVAMWVLIPVGWLWIGSQLTDSTQAALGPYLLVGIGIIVSVIGMGKLLTTLNAAYSRVAGEQVTVRIQLPWMRSMRAEREAGIPASVLDVIMVLSVGFALIALALWFFFLAGSSLPSA